MPIVFKNPIRDAKIPPKPVVDGKRRDKDSETPRSIVATRPQLVSNHPNTDPNADALTVVPAAGATV